MTNGARKGLSHAPGLGTALLCCMGLLDASCAGKEDAARPGTPALVEAQPGSATQPGAGAATALSERGGTDSDSHGKWDIPGVSPYISRAEVALFVPGASLDQIGSALNQRGSFLCCYSNVDGGEVAVIAFGLTEDAPSPFASIASIDTWLFAVFQEGRFAKFAGWFLHPREDYAQEDGSVATRPVRLSVMENLNLAQTYERQAGLGTPEILAPVPEMHYPIDWGLTVGMLPFALVDWCLGSPLPARIERQAIANAAVRMQFDGRRVRLGEERQAIEKLLGDPVECWNEDGLTACAYRSEQRFEVADLVHHSPVIVVYGAGRAVMVFSDALAGHLWPRSKSR